MWMQIVVQDFMRWVQGYHRGISDNAARHYCVTTRAALGCVGLAALGFAMIDPTLAPRGLALAAALMGCDLIVALAVAVFGGITAGLSLSAGLMGAALLLLSGPSALVLTLPLVLEAAWVSGQAGIVGVVLALLGASGAGLAHGGLVAMLPFLGALASVAWASWRLASAEARRKAEYVFFDDRWRALSALTDAGVVRHTAQGAVIGANSHFCRLLGIGADELIDTAVITRLHLSSGPAFLKALSDIAHGAPTAEARVRLRCEEGGEAKRDADPFVSFDIRFSRRVDDPLTGSEEILATYRPVAVAETTRIADTDLAAARLGHELRTPLNAIIGFSECLADPAIIAKEDPKRGDYARIIGTSARHMLDLVGRLPGVSVARERDQERDTPVDVTALVAEAIGMMRLTADTQKARLFSSVDPDTPPLIGEASAYRQILINLLSNALKFAPEGTVHVRVTHDSGAIAIIVEDDGAGIDEADLTRLGEPGFRGRMAHPDAPEGQGLGLSIVRDLVHRHGGVLDVMRRPVAGTRVIARFVRTDAGVDDHVRDDRINEMKPHTEERRYAQAG
jgi:cell cycle sensor histidine kinase DivJ